MRSTVGFIGLGNMGTTIANLVAKNGFPVIGWEYNAGVVAEINKKHRNSAYLKGIPLDKKLTATNDISDVFAQCAVVFIAIPSIYLEKTLAPVAGKIGKDIIVVNLIKGMDRKTGKTSFAVLADYFPKNRRVMLSGPSIANEIAREMPTAVSIAGGSDAALHAVARVLDSDCFKTIVTHDAAGVELGGILKNIYAIGLGIFDGCGVRSTNFRSLYLTLALQEMAALGTALGAKAETFCSLSGLGDLFATSLSEHSHNRRMGELLARGYSVEAVRKKMGVVPEGYNTLLAVTALARRKRIVLPVAGMLAGVIRGKMDARAFVHSVIRAVS